jgi:hypothetical protein
MTHREAPLEILEELHDSHIPALFNSFYARAPLALA